MSFHHKKIVTIVKKDLKKDLFVYCVFFVLFLIFLFSLFNLISIIKIQSQINSLLKGDAFNVSGNDSPDFISISQAAEKQKYKQIYYNVNSDGFSGDALINLEKTNLFFDDTVTALTFKPLYNLKEEKDCENSFCGLQTFNNLSCLKNACIYKKDNQLYYNNSLVELPSYLKDKTVINSYFEALETKWVISYIISEEGQEVAYVYLFDGSQWEGIITNETQYKIKTKYGYGGGSISVGGTDNQFMILYSGYEGLGYLYNNGELQDLSKYFGLRVTNRGFKAKIIKDGKGVAANWYVCGDDGASSKLIKLWQNGTKEIQGAIDLSNILEGESFVCSLGKSRELKLASKKLYTFTDLGFDNKDDYYYQSSNLSSYEDKVILSVNLGNYEVNAKDDSYKFFVSLNEENWQEYFKGDLVLNNNKLLSTFYLKAIFKTFDPEYSPWFNGINIISYRAGDRN